MRLFAFLLAALGCGSDVQLGTNFDARVDMPASNNPFTPGSYMLYIVDSPDVSCMGSLMGSESSFSGLRRADVALADGIVTVAVPTDTSLSLSGTPISSGFGQTQLVLGPNVGDPAIWEGTVNADLGPGPLGTRRMAAVLAVLVTTASNPSISALVGVIYETTDMTGSCDLAFSASLTKL